jgi:hypothetical protein
VPEIVDLAAVPPEVVRLATDGTVASREPIAFELCPGDPSDVAPGLVDVRDWNDDDRVDWLVVCSTGYVLHYNRGPLPFEACGLAAPHSGVECTKDACDQPRTLLDFNGDGLPDYGTNWTASFEFSTHFLALGGGS